MVAAADPMATPTMVPLTPKNEAIVAATTAPATEARTCRMEIFTIPGACPSVSVSIPHGPIDAFAQQIGVAVVAGVLLNHVRHDPSQVTRGPLRRGGEGIEGRSLANDGARV